ncbi:MAG: acyl-CoA dehydrogenase family protein [Motiliproteus sp.]
MSNAFKLDEDYQMIYDAADKFAREQLLPIAGKMDDEESWPENLFPMLGREGYLGVTVPEELGGAGMDEMAQALVAKAFSKYNPAVGLSVLAHDNLCLNNILRNANDEQRKKYIPGMANGTLVGALGLTEPGAGSDALGSMKTTARREGDHYILNGSKIFITNGPIADVVLVYAKTAPEKGAHGISAFIVEKDFPGFAVAQKLIKMGCRGSQTAELVFTDCKVPLENLIGEENNGVAITMSGLDIERAVASFMCLGMASRGLELSIDYAKERQQFNRPIASFQLVQGMLADMYTKLEASRLLAYSVMTDCCGLEEGGGGRGEIHKRTAAAIMFAANSCSQILNDAVQIHGGNGYMWEMEINRLYRASKLLEIGAGTTEVRKIIIAGELLK